MAKKNMEIDSKEESRKGSKEIINDDVQIIDVSNFFNYQRAINSLIDYLNLSIDDMIAGFTRSDQEKFSTPNKKLILNAILESGFYDFTKYKLRVISESKEFSDEQKFLEMMERVQGEIDLLAYLLVYSRMSHRNLNFDLFLSLLKGGLFVDILETHDKIVKDMQKRAQALNKDNIKENVKVNDSSFYI